MMLGFIQMETLFFTDPPYGLDQQDVRIQQNDVWRCNVFKEIQKQNY